jgi:hypothetical protein
VSQRAEHIWEGVSSATTRSRPIINTRDEPHADAERYRRLHVIVGDSTMSETTTLLKVGSADLVLRMIEAGVVMRDLTLENPIRAIREISHDMTGRRKVRLAHGPDSSEPSVVPGEENQFTVRWRPVRKGVGLQVGEDAAQQRVVGLRMRHIAHVRRAVTDVRSDGPARPLAARSRRVGSSVCRMRG